MTPPETRYARNGDVRLAYQIVGQGAFDLVFVPGLVSHLDLTWENPEHARFCETLARVSRVILFDKRGTGLSDRDKGVPGLETRMDDALAVMEAAGSRRAAVFGDSEGGMMSLIFAATYPERVRALALYGAFVHSPTRAWPAAQAEARFDLVERAWGSGLMPPSIAPSKAGDQAFRRNWARFEQQSASPEAAAALLRIDRETDITPVLAQVRVPTLVLHRSGDRRIGVENGRYLAQRVPGARYVELPGDDHLPYVGDSDRVLAEIETFLTQAPSGAAPDRKLATVLALSIGGPVGAELSAVVGAEIARFRGRELAAAPGQLLAAFDGPARAIRCGLAIAERARALGIAAHGGLHTGAVPARGDAGGETAAIAARIAERAGPGETLVSGTVRDLVAGSGLRFEDRGRHPLPGAPEPLSVYAAVL
jgi:pimeloyl-ACP methyl ester carboxylesterase